MSRSHSRAKAKMYEELSKKYNLPIVAIKAICESPFQCIGDHIYRKELHSFNLIGLGKIAIHHRIVKANNLEAKKQEILNKYEFNKQFRKKSIGDSGGVEESDLGGSES